LKTSTDKLIGGDQKTFVGTLKDWGPPQGAPAVRERIF